MDSGNKWTKSRFSISSREPAQPGTFSSASFPPQDLGKWPRSHPKIGVDPLGLSSIQSHVHESLCNSTRRLSSSSSNKSAESMHNRGGKPTPPDSHNPSFPELASTVKIERLSLENTCHGRESPISRGEAQLPAQTTCIKRTASSDIAHPPSKHTAAQVDRTSNARLPRSPPSRQGRSTLRAPRKVGHERRHYARQNNRDGNRYDSKKQHTQKLSRPRDSRFDSLGEDASTPSTNSAAPHEQPDHEQCNAAYNEQTKCSTRLILQPPSSPISKDQLAAEVKSIYAGLVMVEAKCMNIDASQASDPQSELLPDQWQALIALHRTLLYEHHDFLMATQHPSATEALRGLASKYSMPARMWRHGIHSFLEVLRFRRPESQEYMLAFIYLAYQMMALLFETVPMFTDTWIECLGDLARYRMAIEDNKEQHSIWGGVAGRWYNTASDRHPETGRLFHHLGILERPSVKKFFLYTKSLVCIVPFPNAKDSLTTLCTPIVQDTSNYYTGDYSAEASIVTFHAQVYSKCDDARIMRQRLHALKGLAELESGKIKKFGVHLVICNTGALLQLGSTENWLWRCFTMAIHKKIQIARPSANFPAGPGLDAEGDMFASPSTYASPTVTGFCWATFNTLIRLGTDASKIRDLLPSAHAVLVWLYSLQSLVPHTDTAWGKDFCDPVPNSDLFSWTGLCDFLNRAIGVGSIGARTIQFALQGMFLSPERAQEAKPLPEDYTIRGLIWDPDFYPVDWFNEQYDDGDRFIETSRTFKARLDRVIWLAIRLASCSDRFKFDVDRKFFYAQNTPQSGSSGQSLDSEVVPLQQQELSTSRASVMSLSNLASRTSPTPSVYSDEDYTVVTNTTRPRKTWAEVASAPSKRRYEHTAIHVVDDESMQYG